MPVENKTSASPPSCLPPTTHTHTHQHTCTEGFCGCSAPAQTPLKLSSPGNSISNRAHFLVVSGYGSTPPLPPTPPLHPLFLPSSMKLSPFTPRQSDPIWCVWRGPFSITSLIKSPPVKRAQGWAGTDLGRRGSGPCSERICSEPRRRLNGG